jgi:YYY domain-containing protein
MAEAVAWYVTLQLAAIAVWPLVARALEPLADRGWAASKVVGILAVAWLAWLVCMLTPVPFTRATLAIALFAVGALSWAWYARRLSDFVPIAWLRANRWLVFGLECVFAAGYWMFVQLRIHDPAIVATEKPMDMAFLNGFIAAQSLPTQDTWLAGYGVPYYYFGYFVLACIGKLSGVAPGVAYNLAAASVPALTMVALASLIWCFARAAHVSQAWSAAGAGLAVLLVDFGGNWSTFLEFLVARGLVPIDAGEALGINHFAEGVIVGVWPPPSGYWWFHASRIIPNLEPDGINEFPFFSALLSDLHPHFIALPFEVLVLTVAAAHVLSRGQTLRSWWTQALAALALGALVVINTWDIAPYWPLYAGLSLYAAMLLESWRWRWLAALAPLGGVALFAPFFVGFGGPPLGLGIVAERTPFTSMLVLFGWAIALLAAVGLFARWCIGDRRGWTLVGSGAAAGLALVILGQPTLGLLVALLIVLLPWPGVLDRLDPPVAAAVGVGAFAAVILLGCELIFLDDVFHSRMNTVFKFHVNAWLLAGIAAGLGLALVGRFTRRARWLVGAIAALALLVGLVYPVTAFATRLRERPPYGLTLDGLAFLSPDDRSAVRWLAEQNGPAGRAVIAEAKGNDYSTSPIAARMSTYSGAAGVLGWVGHELQWRGPIPELGRRESELRAVYVDAAPDAIRGILDRYGVRYVVVGDVERSEYGEGVSSRFEGVFPVAFRSGSNTIYRVR